MIMHCLRLLTVSGNILEFKIRPSLTAESQEIYFNSIILMINFKVSEDSIIKISDDMFFVDQSYYLNPKNIIEWYIAEIETQPIQFQLELEE